MTLVDIRVVLAPAEMLRRLRSSADERYEPGRYYMRGPGPKTRARAAREEAARHRS